MVFVVYMADSVAQYTSCYILYEFWPDPSSKMLHQDAMPIRLQKYAWQIVQSLLVA
jgi:hypothetical protein